MTTTPNPLLPAVRPTVVPAEQAPAREGAVSFLSNLKRDGTWTLPRHLRLVAFWGNVELDLTRARIAEGTSVIELRCIMGNVEITAPPDIRLEFDVHPFLASAEVTQKVITTPPPNAPLVRVIGKAIAGSVEVTVVRREGRR